VATLKSIINLLTGKNSLAAMMLRERLKWLRIRYEIGDKSALVEALKIYCEQEKPTLPNWVASGVFKAIYKWRECEFRTLDEAFAVQRPKGFTLNTERKKRKLLFLIHDEVEYSDLKKGDALWQSIGHKYNISDSSVKAYYYEADREINPREEDLSG
jgi:hypothetical protein